MGDGYPEPSAVGDEIITLIGSLERQRTPAWKCADLDDEGLRFRLGSAEFMLGSLLKHLACTEDLNFPRDLAHRHQQRSCDPRLLIG